MINYKLASNSWDQKEIDALQRVIDSGNFTMGKEVQNFEEVFADFIGSKYAVMVNSGSSANLLMLSALNLYPKFKRKSDIKLNVVVPAVSWSTSYYPIHQCGFELRFIDVDLRTFNLDVDQLEASIDENTVAVLAVNLLGCPAELEKINQICLGKNIFLLEDNCESFGAKLNDKYCGTFGEMGTFSFFFSHHLQTMEGGMIVTDDFELHNYLKSLRAHGWIRGIQSNLDIFKSTGNAFEDSFRFVLPGYNLRPLEFSGAVGVEQLNKWPSMLENRRNNAKTAKEFLNTEICYLQEEIGFSSWFGFGLVLNKDFQGKRDEVLQALSKENVESRPIVAGNFLKNPVIEFMDCKKVICRNADYIDRNGFFIGNDSVDLRKKIEMVGKILCQKMF